MNDERWVAREARARRMLSRRQTVIGGTFLAAAIGSLALKPRHDENLLGNAKLDTLVPASIGGWQFETASGLVLPPADQLRDRIYSQLLTRAYTKPGQPPIMLLIAYSGAQDGTIQIHRPEVCYPASGYRLTSIQQRLLTLAPGVEVPTRAIVAETEVRHEQLIYWTRLGSHFPQRWSQQHLAVAAENFHGVVPDGVLVRLSSTGNGDQFPLLDGFARALFGAVGPRMRQVLLGPAAH